jgi:hypothetical protein
MGDHPAAAASQQRALALFGDLGSQPGQAYGDCSKPSKTTS